MTVDDVDRGNKFADTFSSFVNTMGGAPARTAAISRMMRDHRTLQQGMMRFFIEFVDEMAKQETDARNEASVKVAKKLVLTMSYEDRFLPTI